MSNIPVNLKQALALHPHLRHFHWTTEIRDKGGSSIAVQHHHFIHEFGESTGLYHGGKGARDDFAQLLTVYYPELQGSLVSFGGRRNFDIKTTISAEERAVRDALKAEEEHQAAKKKQRRGRGRGEAQADAA